MLSGVISGVINQGLYWTWSLHAAMQIVIGDWQLSFNFLFHVFKKIFSKNENFFDLY